VQQTFDWTRAEQLGLLESARIAGADGVSSVALKSVLKAIDGYGRGREAWPSYDSIATSAGVSVRTAKRAVKALGERSLICVQRRGPMTVNHYRIVWSELALLSFERSATATERSAISVERSATMTPTKCHHDTLNDIETTKETTTTENQSLVVVVSLCGVARADQAVAKAIELGMSNCDIQQRIAAWKAFPPEGQRPGVLYNWLTIRGSYTVAKVAELPQLQLAKLPSNAAEIRRAELIRYGRQQAWTHDRLQSAVTRFEQEAVKCEFV
jgi:DNA-binding transcriptional regulator YhcF (GntR family)